MIYLIWKCGTFLSCYRKLIYIANHNILNQQLMSKQFFSNNSYVILHTPFPLKITTHKMNQNPKQSTFREILSLFTFVKTFTWNLQLSVWWNVGPSNRPRKIISQHVGLQRWINGTWKKRREASILLTGRTAECCTLHSWGYEINQSIMGFAVLFPVKAEYVL